jgi:hypothetical protein
LPVDPSILMKYDPRPAPPKPPRPEGPAALVLALVGGSVIFGFFLAAQGSAPAARAFVIVTAVLSLPALFWIFREGIENVRFFDLFFGGRLLGSALTDDGPPSWLKFVTGCLMLLTWVLAFVLIAGTPGVLPGSSLNPASRPPSPTSP